MRKGKTLALYIADGLFTEAIRYLVMYRNPIQCNQLIEVLRCIFGVGLSCVTWRIGRAPWVHDNVLSQTLYKQARPNLR